MIFELCQAALFAALDAFAAARPADPKFTILGGEPLLCRDLVYAALDRIKKLFGPGVPVHLFTNGLLLEKGEAARLLKRGVDLTVSLNGTSSGAKGAVKNIPLPLHGKIRAGVVEACLRRSFPARTRVRAAGLVAGHCRRLGQGSPGPSQGFVKSPTARVPGQVKKRARLVGARQRLRSGSGRLQRHQARALPQYNPGARRFFLSLR